MLVYTANGDSQILILNCVSVQELTIRVSSLELELCLYLRLPILLMLGKMVVVVMLNVMACDETTEYYETTEYRDAGFVVVVCCLLLLLLLLLLQCGEEIPPFYIYNSRSTAPAAASINIIRFRGVGNLGIWEFQNFGFLVCTLNFGNRGTEI